MLEAPGGHCHRVVCVAAIHDCVWFTVLQITQVLCTHCRHSLCTHIMFEIKCMKVISASKY